MAHSYPADLAEVGIWIGGAARFDYAGGLQYSARHTWFSDLGVSYHVGEYGFSLWLVGLTHSSRLIASRKLLRSLRRVGVDVERLRVELARECDHAVLLHGPTAELDNLAFLDVLPVAHGSSPLS